MEPSAIDAGTGKRIVVIGAGIVGAALAYHLASKGARVLPAASRSSSVNRVTGRQILELEPALNNPLGEPMD